MAQESKGNRCYQCEFMMMMMMMIIMDKECSISVIELI